MWRVEVKGGAKPGEGEAGVHAQGEEEEVEEAGGVHQQHRVEGRLLLQVAITVEEGVELEEREEGEEALPGQELTGRPCGGVRGRVRVRWRGR